MVAHQHVGVHGAAKAGGVPAEPAEIRYAILFMEEARGLKMATLDHMQRVAGDLGTKRAQHPDRLAGSLMKQRPGGLAG